MKKQIFFSDVTEVSRTAEKRNAQWIFIVIGYKSWTDYAFRSGNQAKVQYIP